MTDFVHDSRLDGVLAQWQQGRFPGDVAVSTTTTPRQGEWAPFPEWLDHRVMNALSTQGIAQPFCHQVEAWNNVQAGRHIVLATPTASGKTLCYNVPVAHRVMTQPGTRALYLFPTKALARDQEASGRALFSLCGHSAKVVVYDGDTPSGVRRQAKRDGTIIITNPDMLHTGILPHHAGWASFFSGLNIVVVDELHQYRGIFGAHVANVLRRLRRVCRFYGASPTFVCCSATIANPRELAETVTGCPAEVIDRSGAPSGRRHFLMYNPEIVDPIMNTRASAFHSGAELAFDLIRHRISTLVFCQTRRGVEIVLHYLQARLRNAGDDPSMVRGYRGGYLPGLRREVETALVEGRIRAVVATNALELGIDVGGLDAVVMVGYPGTIAATHQRNGRAGRQGTVALGVMVARNNPLDQFLMRNPRFLLDASPERALVQPDNVEVLLAHLKCAAFELPFSQGDGFGSVTWPETEAALHILEDDGYVRQSGDAYHYIDARYPAADVNLRSADGQDVVVYHSDDATPIAKVPPHSARFEVHEGAIYQHDGQTYEVFRFDEASLKAFVKDVPPVYYTTAVEQTHVAHTETRNTVALTGGTFHLGDIRIVETMTGFKKIKFHSHENLGYGDVSLPPLTFEREAAWVQLGRDVVEQFTPDILFLSLEGISSALAQVTSLRLMCDARDIGVVVQSCRDQVDTSGSILPTLFLYDRVLGGVGLAERVFSEMALLLGDTRHLIATCPCSDGCPNCTGPLSSSRDGSLKEAARTICAALASGERAR